jgi:hypothetical protein
LYLSYKWMLNLKLRCRRMYLASNKLFQLVV